MANEIFEEKRSQEYLFLQKVEPKYRNTLHRLIIEYDLKHSPLKIVKAFYNDNQKLFEELKKMINARELYLIDITTEMNSLKK